MTFLNYFIFRESHWEIGSLCEFVKNGDLTPGQLQKLGKRRNPGGIEVDRSVPDPLRASEFL
jgi:hypothetical protein